MMWFLGFPEPTVSLFVNGAKKYNTSNPHDMTPPLWIDLGPFNPENNIPPLQIMNTFEQFY